MSSQKSKSYATYAYLYRVNGIWTRSSIYPTISGSSQVWVVTLSWALPTAPLLVGSGDGGRLLLAVAWPLLSAS